MHYSALNKGVKKEDQFAPGDILNVSDEDDEEDGEDRVLNRFKNPSPKDKKKTAFKSPENNLLKAKI